MKAYWVIFGKGTCLCLCYNFFDPMMETCRNTQKLAEFALVYKNKSFSFCACVSVQEHALLQFTFLSVWWIIFQKILHSPWYIVDLV